MGWEKRGKHDYFYTTRRIDGRAVRHYHGRRPAAQVLAATVAHRKASIQAARDADRRAQAELAPILIVCQRVHVEGHELFRAAMEAAGFHRHNYGAWRRKRMNTQTKPAAEKPSQEVTKPTEGNVADAFDRARRGDSKALPTVRKHFDKHPAEWHKYGRLSARVASLLITQMTRDDLVQREAILRQVQELRANLLGSQPSQIERLIVDRILVGWLNVHILDAAIATMTQGGIKFAEYLLKRHHLATRQYLAATRELQVVRRLLPAGALTPMKDFAAAPLDAASHEDWPLRVLVEEQQADEESSPGATTAPPIEVGKASAPPAPVKPVTATPAMPTSRHDTAAPTTNDLEDVPVIGARREPTKPQWILDVEREFERESA